MRSCTIGRATRPFMKWQQNHKTALFSLPDCKDENQQEVSSLQLVTDIPSFEKHTHSRSNSCSGQPYQHMRTTDKGVSSFNKNRFTMFGGEAHSLAVHLEVDVATPQ